MNDGVGTEGAVRAEWAAALRSLRKLVGLAKVPDVIRIINAVMEAAASQSVPRIDTERTTVRGAIGEDFRFAALIADHRPARRSRAIAEGHTFDLDGREPRPR